jgi:hypothetical protein
MGLGKTFNDSQRQARNLNALLGVSKALASEIRLDDLLQVIVEKAAEVLDRRTGLGDGSGDADAERNANFLYLKSLRSLAP